MLEPHQIAINISDKTRYKREQIKKGYGKKRTGGEALQVYVCFIKQ